MFCVAHHFLVATVLADRLTDDCKDEPSACRSRPIILSVRAGELIAGDFSNLKAFGLKSLATGDQFPLALAKLPFGARRTVRPDDFQGHLLTDPVMTDREVAESLTGKAFIFGLVGSFGSGNAEIWSTDFRTRIETELKK